MKPQKAEAKYLFHIIEETQRNKKILEDAYNDPISILIYEQILSFSKEELESARKSHFPRDKDHSLYDEILFNCQNPLLFMALLSKSFQHKLCSNSKWILNHSQKPDLYTYNLILSLEKVNNRIKENKKIFEEDFFKNKDILLSQIISHNINHGDNNNLLATYYDKYQTLNVKIILDQIYDTTYNLEKRISICEFLLSKNIDINQFDHLNGFLPSDSNKDSFFISSAHNKTIEDFLNMGFRFNENYKFNGKSLFHNLLISQREDLIKIILPTLTNIVPDNEEMQKTIEMDIDNLEHSSTIKSNLVILISRIYNKHKLDLKLPQKKITKNKMKL